MSVVSYVVLGVSARTVGRQHPETVAAASAGTARLLAFLLTPLSALLILLGNVITPGRGYRRGPFGSQAELREMLDRASADSLIEDDERQMINSVFELGGTIAREVMVPRTEMVFVERSKTLRQALSLSLRSGFSRIPVIGDDTDDVVGVVFLKDLVRRGFEHRDSEQTEHVESLMRPAHFVPDSKPVDDMLREMQADREHMAIVVDEFGGTAGLVTIEDILEEIVGEIADEYDTGAPDVVRLGEQQLRVSARLSLEHLCELTGIDLDPDKLGVETVAGLLARRLGRVPIPGAEISEQGWRLEAESAAGRRNRIGTVLVERMDPANGAK
jgi:CBS domain containing-hemolysin-like protein